MRVWPFSRRQRPPAPPPPPRIDPRQAYDDAVASHLEALQTQQRSEPKNAEAAQVRRQLRAHNAANHYVALVDSIVRGAR